MTDSLLILEDEASHLERRREGIRLSKRICLISWTTPLVYLPILWILQHLTGAYFGWKDWLNFSLLVPSLGCLLGLSFWASSHFRSRCLLTTKGLKFGAPNFTFLSWRRLKRWKIAGPSETSRLSVIAFYRSSHPPIALAVPQECDLEAIREFISIHARVPEQTADIDPPHLLSYRVWLVLTFAKWILFVIALPAFRLPAPPIWSSGILLFALFFHVALEHGPGLHWQQINRLRDKSGPAWLRILCTVLCWSSAVGFFTLPLLKAPLMTLSLEMRSVIVDSLLLVVAAWWLSHMILSDLAISAWYKRVPAPDMNTPIGAISRVMLFVHDVPGVAAFYRDQLGLPVLGEITPEWVELQAGSCTIALHQAPKPLHERGDASAKIVFGVKNVPAGKALLEARGVAMGKIHSFSGIDICDGKDPEGNLFQISSRSL